MNGTKFTHYTSEKIKKIHEFVTPDAYYKDGYLHKDLKMIMESLRERKKINVGAEDCFDGSKTMYTIIFPNDKIDCFYVRCSIN